MPQAARTSAPDAKPSSGARAFSPGFWLKLFVVVQLMLLAVEFTPEMSTNGDDAKYFLLGRSLANGNGYRDLYDPQNHVHTQYPPLFPALLGTLDLVSHSPLLPKIAVGLLSAGILLLLFGYFSPSGGTITVPLLLTVALSTSVASHATLLMSEIPYLFATLGALVLYQKLKDCNTTNFLFWLTACAAAAPPFIRTVGIAFLAAWVVTAILDKRYRLALATAALFVAGMVLIRLATEWNSPYVDQLIRKNQYDPELGLITAGEMAGRIGQNVSIYLFSVLPAAILGTGAPPRGAAGVALGLFLALPATVGLAVNFRRPTRILSLYVCCYCVIISLWQTEWAGVRFVVPIVPFVLFFFLSGLAFLLRYAGERQSLKPGLAGPLLRSARFQRGTVVAAAAALAILNFSGHCSSIGMNAGLSNDWKNFYSCADWVRLNTPATAVVASRKPELFFLRAERKGFVYPFSHDVEKVIAGLKQGGARYCILDNFFWTNTTMRYLFPAIASHPELFRVVYSLRTPDTYVLEFTGR